MEQLRKEAFLRNAEFGASPTSCGGEAFRGSGRSATAAPVKTQPAKTAEPVPLEEQIRKRAHELWLQRGNINSGSAIDDWLQAEEEIKAAQEK